MASRLRLALLVAVGATLLACSGSEGEPGGGEATSSNSGPRRLIADDTLTVCVDAPKYPFAFQDASQNWLGSDIEIIEAVADELDLTVAVVTAPFDGIWAAPATGTCDVAAAAITITPERSSEAAFSVPYMEVEQSLLVRKADVATYATLAALADRPVGVKAGTTSEDHIASNLPAGATIVSLPETEALFVALGSSDVDGVIADFPINGYRSTLDTAVTVTERFSTGEQYGFAVAPDNLGLVDDINDALEDYLSSEDFTDLQFRWFGQ